MDHRTARPVVATVTSMDEYQRRVLQSARDVLARHGIPLVVHVDGPYTRGAGSPLLVSLLTRTAPLGVITMNQMEESDQREVFRLLEQVELPVVHVGIESDRAAGVRGDNGTGMRQMMGHLLDERDIRRPVLVRGSEHQPDSIAREAIFREELVGRGLAVDEELVVTGEFHPEATYPVVRALLDRRRDMDAVVALNDPMAIAAMAALGDAGLRIPEDVLVTGFDDDVVAGHWPGLTTVDQHLEEQGETAATLLLEQLDGAPPRNVVVASQLVRRGSTAANGTPPVTDVEMAERMARLAQGQLAAQAGLLAMRQALDYCWTVEQAVNTLGDHLERLGVTRCFLALYEPEPDGDTTTTPRVNTERAELALDHRDGRMHYPTAGCFPAHRLLPDALTAELEAGLLVLQPLGVLDRPIGFVLYEQAHDGAARLSELLRSDLSRAIDGILTTQEHQTRADQLEQAVARRTAELRTEVQTRQRAEKELQRANAELRRSAMVDGLTQIANRSAFEEYLNEHWDRQAVEGGELALLMADVDEFKAYNDHYGHVLGDDALRTIATCLDRSVRETQDLACRFGGEEFAVVLPRSGVDGALAIARRFQELLAGLGIPHAASRVAPTLTVSIGVATASPLPGTHPNDVVGAADRALYRAKDLGRDRIVVDPASHEVPTPTPAGVTTPRTPGPASGTD